MAAFRVFKIAPKATSKLPKIHHTRFHLFATFLLWFLPHFKHVNKSIVIESTLTVNSPVTASKPTCTVCSKFVGYEMLGLESLCDCFDFILFFSVFFLRSGSSGSAKIEWHTFNTRESSITSTIAYLWAKVWGPVGRPIYHFRPGCWSDEPAALAVCLPHSTLCCFRVSILSIALVCLTPTRRISCCVSPSRWFIFNANPIFYSTFPLRSANCTTFVATIDICGVVYSKLSKEIFLCWIRCSRSQVWSV